MSREELREAYVEAMIELEEVHRKEKHGNKGWGNCRFKGDWL